jgi:hypothetical protein
MCYQQVFILYNGEGGIRTLGTALRSVQQISNLPLSTTQPPLQIAELHHSIGTFNRKVPALKKARIVL